MSCDELLGVGEPEGCAQYLFVAEMTEIGQRRTDVGRDRVILFAMPTEILLRLLLKILDIRHGRKIELVQ